MNSRETIYVSKSDIRAIAKLIQYSSKGYLYGSSYKITNRLYSFLIDHNVSRNVIGSYKPLPYEVDISHFNSAIQASGSKITIANPEEREITYRLNNEVVVPDIIILPCLAFTANKARIGHGFGGYDKYIEKVGKNSLNIGVCYGYNQVENVLIEEHDKLMDYVVTEDGIW